MNYQFVFNTRVLMMQILEYYWLPLLFINSHLNVSWMGQSCCEGPLRETQQT